MKAANVRLMKENPTPERYEYAVVVRTVDTPNANPQEVCICYDMAVAAIIRAFLQRLSPGSFYTVNEIPIYPEGTAEREDSGNNED